MGRRSSRRKPSFNVKKLPTIAGVLLILIGSLGIYSVIWLESQPLTLPDMEGEADLYGIVFHGNVRVDGASIKIIDTSTGNNPSNRSNEEGEYTIEGIDAGEATVVVSHYGYRTIHVKALLYSREYLGSHQSNRLDIRLTSSVERHDSQLNLSRLWGNVATGNGTPLGQANVSIPAISQNTTTDSNGTFNFINVTPGRYVITSSHLDFINSSKEVLVLPNQTHINLIMDAGNGSITEPLLSHFHISGSVSDDNGKTLDRVQLFFFGTNTTLEPMASGNFGFQIRADIYDIWAYADGYVTEIFSNVIVNRSLSLDFTLEAQEPQKRSEVNYFGYHYCAILQALFACFALIGGTFALKRVHLNMAILGCFCGLISIGPNFAVSSILSLIALFLLILSRRLFKKESAL